MDTNHNRLMVWAITLETALAALRDRDRPCETGVDIRDGIQGVIDELKAAAGEKADPSPSDGEMLEWTLENAQEIRWFTAKNVGVHWVDENLDERWTYGADGRAAIRNAMIEEKAMRAANEEASEVAT